MPTSSPSRDVLLLVGVGGAVGTLLRHLVGLVVGPAGGLPLGTLAVNLLGALALGVVVSTVADPRLRALLGTGLLGGFTTYSAFALQGRDLLVDRPALGLAYLLMTATGGFVLALCGLALGRRLRLRRGGGR